MPDGHIPTQFVALQLESVVAPSGESVKGSGVTDAMTDGSEVHDDGMYSSCVNTDT